MYRVLLDGVPIECESLEEAKRLARSIAHENRSNEHSAKERPASSERRDRFRKDAVHLLKELRSAGPGGITGEKLGYALGIKKLKGLGPIAAALKRRLSDLGIDPQTACGRTRVGGERKWVAKEKIEEAIKAMEG